MIYTFMVFWVVNVRIRKQDLFVFKYKCVFRYVLASIIEIDIIGF